MTNTSFINTRNALNRNLHGKVDVFLSRVPRFSSVQCLSMYFPSNFGAETTKISYIGLKGEFQEVYIYCIVFAL